ncbi:YadA-like family protein [Pollutimonas harenae]|uniref:YadA-like family protein n=1 Tax=Pollutimonas harenae TaxID=657015 RepID=A0A853GYX4_9BURK|nr:YadA-like family protein [Pollutimonas harenae]NYT84960.1 YadA-like family protein [Pollutimonas harenae]TEA72649.1 hypothetical protein ERD84_01710 [Pollutimonas harenae]
MNRIYKTVWNEQTRTFVAVSELTNTRGKRSGSSSVVGGATSSSAKFRGVLAWGAIVLSGAGLVGASIPALADVTVGNEQAVSGNSIEFSIGAGNINFADGGTISGLSVVALTADGTSAATTGQLYTTTQELTDVTARVAINEGAITALNSTVSGHTTDIADHNARISANKSDITTLEQRLYTQGDGVKYFHTNSTLTDSDAAGVDSIAIGAEAVSAGQASVAAGLGASTTETAEDAIALGHGATAGTVGATMADGAGSIAIGRDSQASGNSTLALGDGAKVEDMRISNAAAIGTGARVSGAASDQAMALGHEAHASAARATAVGAAAKAGATDATALGAGASASGAGSIAIGQSIATAGSALAAGTGAYAGTANSIALGVNAGVGTEGNAAGDRTDHIAIGTSAGQTVVGNQSIAIGYKAGSSVTGDDNIALGTNAGGGISGNNNIAIGVGANNGAGSRAQSIAIGANTRAGSDSVAVGDGARAIGSETLALGKDAGAEGNGVAMGAHAWADGNSIALGRNSAARTSDLNGSGYLTGEAAPGSAVSVGNTNSGLQRRIVNVADGAQGYDAVNVRQLRGAQQSVATLIGGSVAVNADGTFSPITVKDAGGNDVQFNTVVDAIGAVTSGTVDILPVDAVRYNTAGGISNVAAGINATDAVNVEQLNEAVAENGVKYFSANTNIAANRINDGATGANAMAVGPAAVADGDSSLAIGNAARTTDGANEAVAIGYDVSARAKYSTVLGNSSHAYDQGGVAIGQLAVSRGQNSIVMGTGAESDPKSSGTVDNAIVIGTSAEATADDGIAIGQSALASAERAVAQGYDAHAMADDAVAIGTRSRASGVSSQASGTDASASGENAQASGTGAQASGYNAIASGTGARGYAADGIALGTGAVSGLASPLAEEAARNRRSIAIGDHALADYENALALGVSANARAESATAVGDAAAATADDALAVGSAARATALNASAFGQGAQAMHQNSVALGSGAITTAPIGTSSTTIDKITYNYAGTAPLATVSVGDVGAERTITNVAAGRVSSTSTDAINGSQLFQTNTAVTALGNNLDTAGQSVAAALGGTSVYDPALHTVIAGLSVQGNTYTNVQDALTYVGQGWDVSTQGGASANVAPGGSVDFSNTDSNVVISRTGTDLAFNLADDLDIGNSITVGDTVINGDSVTTNNLTVEGNTQLGPNFEINSGGAYYTGPITEGNHITNKTYVDGAVDDLADTPLTFAGDSGSDVARQLGQTVNLTGGATDAATLTDGNIGVVANGTDTLAIKLSKDIDLGVDGSVKTGNSVMNTRGLTVSDGANTTTTTALGTTVSGSTGTTTVGAGVVTVAGGSNTITINGTSGDITGLANRDLDAADFGKAGRAATEEQLQLARDETKTLDDRAVKYDLNPDGTTVNYNVVTMAGDTGNATQDSSTGLTTMTGGTQIKNVASAGDYKDVNNAFNAVNAGDLNNAVQDVTSTGLNFSANDGADVHRDLGQTLAIRGGMADTTPAADTSGENVITRTTADGIEIELAKDVVFDSVATGNTVMNSTGLTVNDTAAGTLTSIGSGAIALADNSGNITTIEPTQVVVGGSFPIVIGGKTGVISGLQNQTINYPGFGDGSGRAATEEQLKPVTDFVALNNDGTFSYNGQNHPTLQAALDSMQWNIEVPAPENSGGGSGDTGGPDGTSGSDGPGKSHGDVGGVGSDSPTPISNGNTVGFVAGNNIVISKADRPSGTGADIKVAMAQDISVNSITAVNINAGQVKADRIEINNGGPIIDEKGINMADNRITNVAPGVDEKDAVNVGQLQQTAGNLQNQVNDLRGDLRRQDKRLSGGVAAAMATAALPQAYLPGKTMMSMAGGTWNSESGMAIGFSGISDNGHWVYKLSGNATSRGDYGGAVGVGYQW